MPNKFVYDQLGSPAGLEVGVYIVDTEGWPAVATQLILDFRRLTPLHFLVVQSLVILVVLFQWVDYVEGVWTSIVYQLHLRGMRVHILVL